MFIRKTIRTKGMTFVEEYHTARYGAPGHKREPKRKPTPEEVRQVNQRQKMRKCHIRLEEYFTEEDWFLTLTYSPEKRPADMAEAKGHFSKLIGRLKTIYKKAGEELRWIRNIERGTKGAWHIHLAIKALPGQRVDRIVQGLWEYGFVNPRVMVHEGGGFRSLAGYLTKSEVTDKRKKETSYSTSRNMPLPEPEKKIISYRSVGKPRTPKGFLLDRDSFFLGVNPFTGYLYSTYAYTKIGGNQCRSGEPARCRSGPQGKQ